MCLVDCGALAIAPLISISADLPELTGVIVPTEYLPQRMKHIHSLNLSGLVLLSFIYAVAFFLSYQLTITGYHPSMRAWLCVR